MQRTQQGWTSGHDDQDLQDKIPECFGILTIPLILSQITTALCEAVDEIRKWKLEVRAWILRRAISYGSMVVRRITRALVNG